ncbi:glycosyltransferase family 4 protein [Paenibacillus lemnae]|uniref:Glycosyltransferase family 4 protein n=1 Tax=Paenibacillus lemnae TaxID=1330551 RepID=A0A848M3Q6_PAELE|nr:glycosyltransferase family 4 protein [Paenibacillus lemnae]NMO95226.1 glycosyltransferase family 4 protein [Paenibacillus lemnae]
MRKVAVVTPGSFVIPSVRSSSVERVIEQVVPLARHELDIRIYGTIGKGLPLKSELHGVPCIRLPSGSYLQSLVRNLKMWGPDVIEVNNRPLAVQKLKAKMPGVKVVLNLHSNTFIRPPYLRQIQLQTALEQADGLIVNSRYLKEFVESGFRGERPQILINPLGVKLEDFSPRHTPASEAIRAARLERLGLLGKKIILFVGRLMPEKGVHHLIAAMPDILAEHPDTHLLVIGSAGYSSDRETAYVKKLKSAARPLKSWITFLSYIPFPSLALWYTMADLVVVPSSTREAFGLVNVEAMAAAVPVVAARSGGIPEVIEEGVSGFLVPPESLPEGLVQPITRLLGDEELRCRLGTAGRESCRQQFRWDLTAQRWADFMQHI